MKSPVILYEQSIHEGRLSPEQTRVILGSMIARKSGEQLKLAGAPVDPIPESSIRLNVSERATPIKLGRAEHVDAFFRTGQLHLGTLEFYQQHEHREVRDELEGFCWLVGYSGTAYTVFLKASGGADQHVFCCAMTNNPRLAAHRFGYDAAYEILDPDGFSMAVANTLRAIRERRAVCAYAQHKALVGEVDARFTPGTLSAASFDSLLGAAKYFVKPLRFSRQIEYRFLWELEGRIEKPAIVECPEAVKFCRRIAWSKR